MKLSPSTLLLFTLLLFGSLGLAAWWSMKLQPLNQLSWKTLPPDIPALPNLQPAPAIQGGQTLERPIFWESRRPMPPAIANPTPPVQAPVPMELLGIVGEGTQRVALLRPLQGTPPLIVRRLRAGESFSGMMLQSIDIDRVTLNGANGLQVLTLKRGSENPLNQQPAKLSAPQTIEATRQKLPADLQKRIDELKTKAANQAQQAITQPQ